jgi:putative transposase
MLLAGHDQRNATGSVADQQDALRMRLRELAGVWIRFGYRRLPVLLARERWTVNHRRIYRLYRSEGLGIGRQLPRRPVACVKSQIRPTAEKPNECWSIDFISDQLFDGRRLKVLLIVKNQTRERLALDASSGIRGMDVVPILERITRDHGYPKRIKVDNGPEFISKHVDRWAYSNHVELDFSRPGTPSDNALVEAFNSRFRQECLNEHWFLSPEDARSKISSWQTDYNTERPHSALGYRSPVEIDSVQQGQEATAA